MWDLGEAGLLQDEGAVEKYNEEVPNQEHQNPLRGRKKKKEEEKKRRRNSFLLKENRCCAHLSGREKRAYTIPKMELAESVESAFGQATAEVHSKM